MSENPCPCNLAAWPSATMNTNVLELPMYSAASNRKQEFTLRRSPRPGRRWNLQTSSSPSPTAIPPRRPPPPPRAPRELPDFTQSTATRYPTAQTIHRGRDNLRPPTHKDGLRRGIAVGD